MSKDNYRFLQGNEACAEGAIYAGCSFFAGYPITPSSEIAEYLARKFPFVGGRFIQMEDEIAAMAAIIGASLAGRKSITATSGPGYSLKQENIGYACMAEIPCVIVNVMRGGPSTGLPTSPSQSDMQQAKWGTHGDHPAIALSPSSVQELFTETVRAFNLSEQFRTPVTILTDEIVGHMREKVRIPEPGEIEIINRTKPTDPPETYKPYDVSKSMVPPMANFGEGYRYHVTGLNHDETGFPTTRPDLVQKEEERLINKVLHNRDKIDKYEHYKMDDAEIAIIAFGSTARSAKAAIDAERSAGRKVGMLRLITLWPFPDDVVMELKGRVKAVIVPEMNLGQLIVEVERCLANVDGLDISGVNRVDGEPITPTHILDKLEEVY